VIYEYLDNTIIHTDQCTIINRTNEGGTVSLSTFKGKKPVVLFFYPKAATPGCTKEVGTNA
jgi:peroxiredoxin